MRNFEKSSKLDNVLYDVRGPVVDEAARMEETAGYARCSLFAVVWFE